MHTLYGPLNLKDRMALRLLVFLLAMTVGISVAQAQTANSVFYPTAGKPMDAVVTSSGDVLVSVNDGQLGLGTGIQVFKPTSIGTIRSSCVDMLAPSLSTLANGGGVYDLSLFPNGTDVAAAADFPGDVFYHLSDLLGCNNATGYVIDQGSNPTSSINAGTFDQVITKDGNYAFIANEYGTAPNATLGAGITLKSGVTLASLPGNIAVVQIERDSEGNFTGTKVVGNISTGGAAIPGILLSPDGTRLYVVSEASEIASDSATQPADNVDSATGYNTVSSTCASSPTSPTSTGTSPNGLLTVIDVAQVEASPSQPPQSAILSTVAAGCGPVRMTETSDGSTLWVAARGSSRVLAFSTEALESNPSHSLLAAVLSGGVAPVGIRLFDNDQQLAVANSDRFDSCSGAPADSTKANVTIFDASSLAAISNVQTVPTECFPRSITVGPDDTTLYVTNYSSKMLQVIQTSAASKTYYISGTVTDTGGQPMPGVPVTVYPATGSSQTATTDLYGYYVVAGLPGNESDVVLPNKAGYDIEADTGYGPFATIGNSSVTGLNYTATLSAGTYAISGTVHTSFSQPMVGVPVQILNNVGLPTYTPKTNANGYYSQVVPNNEVYLLWPTENDYEFSTEGDPFVTVSGASVSGENTTGTWLSGYSISGTVTDSSGNPMPGVQVRIAAVSEGLFPPTYITTDANGNYSVAGFPGDWYSLLATKAGYSITGQFPDAPWLFLSSNTSSENFVGTSTTN